MPHLSGCCVTLLKAENVSVRLAGRMVLSNVNLSLEPQEIVTIVGPNGSGKSTLLRTLIGAVEPEKGTVTKAANLRVGYVPQKLHVDPALPLTVMRFMDLPKRVGRKRAEQALRQAGVVHVAQSQMSALSGGQFQRVLLARAILSEPDVLLLDEATQGLDQPGAASFYRQIEAVRAEMGCAILMVSHELHVVMSASDRVICLNGHVCCEGTPAVVSAAPAYRELFGTGTGGALALYRHDHDHHHDHVDHDHS